MKKTIYQINPFGRNSLNSTKVSKLPHFYNNKERLPYPIHRYSFKLKKEVPTLLSVSEIKMGFTKMRKD